MEPLDYQDCVELTNLVVQAQADALVRHALSKNRPTTRMVYMKQLEMKMIRLAEEKK